jgi:hypothetical protein
MLALWLDLGALQKIQRKLGLYPIWNIELFLPHMESELGFLGACKRYRLAMVLEF